MTGSIQKHGSLPDPNDNTGRDRVVFLHGRGANERSGLMFIDVFPDSVLLLPRGGVREGPGFAWFRNVGIGIADEASLTEEVTTLEAWIDAAVPSGSRVWLSGISNGAAMAGALLSSRPQRYAGAMFISGPFVHRRPWPPGRFQGLPIQFVYGDQDPVIPQHLMQDSVKYLTDESGAEVTVSPYMGGHFPTLSAVTDVTAWFKARSKAA